MKMMRRSPDERLQKAADCLSRYGVLDRILCRCRLEGTTFKLHPNSLSDDGTGLGLETLAASFSRFSKPFIRAEVPTFFRITLYFRRKPTRDRLFSTPKPSASSLFRQTGQRLFQNGESSLKLFIGNHKGHQQPNNVAVTAAGEQQQPFFTASGNQSLGLIGCRQF